MTKYVYMFAIKGRRCFGHGDYGDVICIEPTETYGPSANKEFHPAFKSLQDCLNYVSSLKIPLDNVAIAKIEVVEATLKH